MLMRLLQLVLLLLAKSHLLPVLAMVEMLHMVLGMAAEDKFSLQSLSPP